MQQQSKPYMKPIHLVLCALFAALTAVLSQIAINLGPVPFNLATFSVLTAGAVLGKKLGAFSQLVYVLLGAVGVPVFSLFRGGLAMLVGPTGGYLVGYVLGAFVVGLLAERLGHKIHWLVVAMLGGFVTYMTLGTVWFMILTKNSLSQALALCVVPFLLGDSLKIAVAAVLSSRLRPLVQNRIHPPKQAE